MKTVDLTKEEPTLADVLTLARSEAVLIHSDSGEDFVLEQADEFDREVAALGSNPKFMSLLTERSKETGDVSLEQVRAKRGL